jgi:hypothetical protein
MLVAEAVYELAICCSGKRMIARRYRALVNLVGVLGIENLDQTLSDAIASQCISLHSSLMPYPEVNIQISTSSKFSITDLEGDGHLVVCMKLLMEAFSRMSFEVDVVGNGRPKKRQGAEDD